MKKREDILDFLKRNEYDWDLEKIEKKLDSINDEQIVDALYELITQVSIFEVDFLEILEKIKKGHVKIVFVDPDFKKELNREILEECFETMHYIFLEDF